jgi:hypothetical protein
VEFQVRRGEAAREAGRKVGFFTGLDGFLTALRERALTARIVRFGSVGDPAWWLPEEWRFMRAATLGAGLTPICYTSRWRELAARHLQGQAMASTTSPAEAAEALRQGWQPTAILPWDHDPSQRRFVVPGFGAVGVVCPEQTGRVKSCNDCRLCDGNRTIAHPTAPPFVVGFIDHSHSANARRNARAKRGMFSTPTPAPEGEQAA